MPQIDEIRKDLSYYELRWLSEHGGRIAADVNYNQSLGKYVYMGDGSGDWKSVQIPNTKQLKDMYDKKDEKNI